jgi:hypothetical protein
MSRAAPTLQISLSVQYGLNLTTCKNFVLPCTTLTDLAFPSNGEDDDQKDDSDDLWGLGERGVLGVVSAKEVVNTDPPQSISEGKEVESTVSLEPILLCKMTYALAKGPSEANLLTPRLDIRRALSSRHTPTIKEPAIPRPLSL